MNTQSQFRVTKNTKNIWSPSFCGHDATEAVESLSLRFLQSKHEHNDQNVSCALSEFNCPHELGTLQVSIMLALL